MRMVRMLLKKERSVNEIAESLEITQYNVSKHLRVLREAGLLQTEKQGQQRLYSLAEDFQSHLNDNNNVLDLGCCTFDFNKLPK
jgi:DNA-binding transcriptional ArsR family regulator